MAFAAELRLATFESGSLKTATRYNCNFPALRHPVGLSSLYRHLGGVKNVEAVTVDVSPVGCPPGKYGLLCDKTCICKNGARCHGFNGACKCTHGWQGEFCDEACDCLRGASCDWRSGCVCPPGWTGDRCQTPCPNGTYGERCAKKCRCRNGASCAPSGGECSCTAGWYGSFCDVPCPRHRHGFRCQKICTCKNNATCDNVDGSCTCAAPWKGKNCDEIQAIGSKTLVELLVPSGFGIALLACVAIVLHKKRPLCDDTAAADGETEALLELEQVQTDLAQTVQPGWLRRWETSSRHLTLGHLVGMGMFGHVIQAKLKISTGEITTVAAKAVRRKDTQCYRNFYKEPAILVAVHEDQHHENLRSNIIQLLGLVNEASRKYILMEYASKGNLLRLLRRTRRQNGPGTALRRQ
ncbi:PREDICTED: multiple epidermal growth factor-like domains protein 6 [Branchiostoma belcheri]|uniref:Multiple epidermal growth factor-like domains protein 6 n=1 Tax=Branchiostoma belcheri TaxID=7741 RepID=A0A6P5A1B6_BRABE|nr:PREDICTED: multiple epidermal growth factor-like domains protein 6 [Branchiostoma belcheri]